MRDFADILKSRSIGLVLPRECDDEINRYVAMHSGEREDVEHRPFRRQVDFWTFCIAIALAYGLELSDGTVSKWGKTFIYTNQGILNNDIGSLLAVVTVARLGHEDPNIDEPGRIIELANRLAGAGCPLVLKELAKPDLRTTPLDRVLELASKMQDEIRSTVHVET
ncbi:MAG: hypothetical protein F4Y22_10985 [Gammaproteobacteria bacterium]|nr:hypothetical protein [Gammaproteobacteria bacterium]MYH47488.1 hypothetical protein [Gammaproteobacteria bacterium]MYL12328.1 hypothetical protein [Gammaproteobacteria bacterium]